jgi:hypothetical protein
LVIRGGVGFSYNQNEIAITANGGGNPPNAVSANFNCPYPFTANPSCAGNGIVYETATDVHSIFGYAPNSNAITTFGSNNLPICPAPCAAPTSVTGFPSNPKTIHTLHYSLDVQYQLPVNTIFSMGYQGNETRHLLVQNNWNAVAAGYGLALNPGVSGLDYYQNTGSANFNALVASLNHNFSHTFQASVQYTWAKAMDENSGPYTEDPYPYDTAAAYGRSDYNVKNAFKLFGLWQPVFFHGSRGWIDKVAGEWSLSGIWNLHSGFPWTPTYGTNTLYYQGSGYSSLRPSGIAPGAGSSTSNSAFMQTANPNYGGNGTQFFLPPSYVQGPAFPATAPPPAPGIQRNSLNGPGYNDVDFTLSKGFGLPNNRILGESARFEIRADVYNFFNKINLNVGQIDTNLGSVAPNTTGGFLVTPNSDFGVARQALGSRTVQLQARFSF